MKKQVLFLPFVCDNQAPAQVSLSFLAAFVAPSPSPQECHKSPWEVKIVKQIFTNHLILYSLGRCFDLSLFCQDRERTWQLGCQEALWSPTLTPERIEGLPIFYLGMLVQGLIQSIALVGREVGTLKLGVPLLKHFLASESLNICELCTRHQIQTMEDLPGFCRPESKCFLRIIRFLAPAAERRGFNYHSLCFSVC